MKISKMRLVKPVCAIIAAVLFVLPLVGCSGGGSEKVMTIGELDVSYDMLRYFALNYMQGYSDITAEDFKTDPELQSQLSENILSSLTELAAYLSLAKEYNIKLDSDDNKTIDEEIEDIKKEYGGDEEAYKEGLADANATEAVVRRIYEIQLICDKLYDYLTDSKTGIFKSDNATIEQDIAAGNWFSAEYLLITYSSDRKESRREYAEKLLTEYGEDISLADIYEDKRTVYGLGIQYGKSDAFTYTQQKEYFEEAVVSLEIGQRSGVLDTADGFLIVKRLELDEEYIDDYFITTFCSGYLEREFFGLVEKTAEGLEVRYTDKYKDIRFSDIS